MRYIDRSQSIITGKKNLEHLYTFKNFPVFMGCVENLDGGKDLRADMSFSICKDSGIIQLNKVLPLEIVYINGHADGTGPLWQEHYIAFAKFLRKFPIKNVLEIGGGNGAVAKHYMKGKKNVFWTILEPNPLFKGNKKIKVMKGWFDHKFKSRRKFDAIVHSHVLEHIYDPSVFIKSISKIIEKGDKHIFAVPNLYKFLIKKHTNSINFEHTIFLTEYFIDYLLKKYGFGILKKDYYLGHSIYYATEKKSPAKKIEFASKYKEYKKIFKDFIKYHKDLIKNLNSELKREEGEVYLFGAHIFSQYLFEFGLDAKKIKGILDNSPLKHNKRLYGTSFMVFSPDIIKVKENITVILKAASYQEEIRNQLLSINKNVRILE